MQIPPSQFEQHSRVAIENNINAKFSNRVIQKIGLCICMYDLLWASEGLIGHGDGLVNVNGTYLPTWPTYSTHDCYFSSPPSPTFFSLLFSSPQSPINSDFLIE